jgi:hypothetical protein
MSHSSWSRDHGERVLIGLALLYFAVRAVYFALQIHPFVPPDEVTHVGRILAFSTSWLPPDDGPATYPLGLVTRVPTLYSFALGKLLWLNRFGVSDLVFLRLLNVPLGVLTVVYAVRWIRLLSGDAIVRALFLVMLTNSFMFGFLAGSVSYDNLTNLLAAAAIYYLYSYFATRSAVALLSLLLCLALGGLTKVSFLPLVLILLVLLGLHERRSLAGLVSTLGAALRRPTPRLAATAAALLLALALDVGLYGGNLVRYGRVTPSADQVIGLEAALENRIFARNHIIAGFHNRQLTLEQATEMAQRIRHPGDRANTLTLLRAPERWERRHQVGPLAYLSIWTWQMLRSTCSPSGHAVLNKSAVELSPYIAMAGLAFVGLLLRRRTPEAGVPWAVAIALPYILLLVWHVGYPAYRLSGAAGLAVQGRYAFPVLLPVYGLLAHYLVAVFPERVRLAAALAVASYFVWQDFPWFLAHVPPAWFIRG